MKIYIPFYVKNGAEDSIMYQKKVKTDKKNNNQLLLEQDI